MHLNPTPSFNKYFSNVWSTGATVACYHEADIKSGKAIGQAYHFENSTQVSRRLDMNTHLNENDFLLFFHSVTFQGQFVSKDIGSETLKNVINIHFVSLNKFICLVHWLFDE